MKVRYGILSVAICFAVVAPAGADDEAANRTHVAAGAYGQCYAISVPGETTMGQGYHSGIPRYIRRG